MERRRCLSLRTASFLLCICLNLRLLLVAAESVAKEGFVISSAAAAISRDDFPSGFIFGAGTSAYQVEGAAAEDGRKPSIWDTFTHAGKTDDKKTADVTADQYHKYKEDVKLMHEMGLDAYRFSFSWSRLIPDGRGPVNPKGLEYYNNLIDELLRYNIKPLVTLHHFDLPQALEDEYEGLLSPKIVEDFTAYADLCFREFGDRVKYWITFNEPNIEPIIGHGFGMFPPGRCSYPCGNCSKGDSAREPFIVAHNVLLSHASAAALYKEKYWAEHGGQIGLTILALWIEPFSDLPEDVAEANKFRELHMGWFLDPLVYGTYPASMKRTLGSRLPSFSAEETKRLKGSFDFIGLNHYSAFILPSYSNSSDQNKQSCFGNLFSAMPSSKKSFGEVLAPNELPELPILPWSLQKMLEYVKEKYGNPPVMIHENGYGDSNFESNDEKRTYYLKEYTESLLQSIRNGSNALGYFVWSFIDCFELMFGYTTHYGLYGVDFSRADRRRYPRLSGRWYSDFLRRSSLKTRASGIDYTE